MSTTPQNQVGARAQAARPRKRKPGGQYDRASENRSSTSTRMSVRLCVQHAARAAESRANREHQQSAELLKACKKRKADREAMYVTRDVIDDDDRSGRKLYLAYKDGERRNLKNRKKRARASIQNIESTLPQSEPPASPQDQRGEQRSACTGQYSANMNDDQTMDEFKTWCGVAKERRQQKYKARSAAKRRIQETGTYRQFWQHMRWHGQDPKMIDHLYGAQISIDHISADRHMKKNKKSQRQFVSTGRTPTYTRNTLHCMHSIDTKPSNKSYAPQHKSCMAPWSINCIWKKVTSEPSWEPTMGLRTATHH